MTPKNVALFLLFVPLLVSAQERKNPSQASNDLERILQRLDRLEQENRDLAAEVHALRMELAAGRAGPVAPPPQPGAEQEVNPPAPPLEERVAVNERRIEDLAQTKVEASQRLPVSLTGMLLFNTFLNGKAHGGFQDPLTASLTNNPGAGGGSPSQTIIGLRFQGPRILGGGQTSGMMDFDLWGGTPSNSLNHLIRLRIARIQIDWKNQSLSFGQDKPLVSPRDPDSLAQVAFSPLTAAGNLWLWQPQVRFEQRLSLGADSGLRAQAAVYQTSEPAASAGAEYAPTLSPSRPALEGRFELWHNLSENARVQIAPGFHVSDTHVAGVSLPSRLFTLDWLIQPVAKFQLTGAFFQGRNAAGLGGLRQGFTLINDAFTTVDAAGGWSQLSYFATSRLTFNAYAGQESDSSAQLLANQIARNLFYAANARYRFGSNILIGLEISQARTKYVAGPNRLVNHYDLALGYLF
jgi:hypothetical protein